MGDVGSGFRQEFGKLLFWLGLIAAIIVLYAIAK